MKPVPIVGKAPFIIEKEKLTQGVPSSHRCVILFRQKVISFRDYFFPKVLSRKRLQH